MSDITIIYLLIGAAVVFFLWLRWFIRRYGENFPNLQHTFGVRKRHHQTDDHNNMILPAAIAAGYVAGSAAQSTENPTSNDVGASSDSVSASSDSGSSGGDSGGGGGGDGGGGGGGD